jgi:hypothetical protein
VQSELLCASIGLFARLTFNLSFFVNYLKTYRWPTKSYHIGIGATFVDTFSLVGEALSEALEAVEDQALGTDPFLLPVEGLQAYPTGKVVCEELAARTDHQLIFLNQLFELIWL